MFGRSKSARNPFPYSVIPERIPDFTTDGIIPSHHRLMTVRVSGGGATGSIRGNLIETEGARHEHLDNIVCDFAGRVDLRLYRFPCGGWVDSPAVDFRRNLFDPALRHGQESGITGGRGPESRMGYAVAE
jgi:hypothetical protein